MANIKIICPGRKQASGLIQAVIEGMTRDDLISVHHVDKLAYGDKALSFGHLKGWHKCPKVFGTVAHTQRTIIGYLFYHWHAERKTATFLRVAVHPTFQRMGIGKTMVENNMAFLGNGMTLRAVAMIEETDLAGQLMFAANNFLAIGVNPEASPDGRDVYDFCHEFGPCSGR